VEKEKAV